MKGSGLSCRKSVKEINTTNSRRCPRVRGNKRTIDVIKNEKDKSISGRLSNCNTLPAKGLSSKKSDSEDCGTDQSENSTTGTSSSSNIESSSYSLSANKKISSGGMKFYPGLRLEAKDLGHDIWYAVKVVEVDQEEDEILIHFEKWSQRYDEWIPMDSSRLRPIQEPTGGFAKKNIKLFKIGDNVMATWTDSRKYPAKIKTVLGNDRYEVLFYDGFIKNIKGGRMTALSDEELAKVEHLNPGLGPSNDVTVKTPPVKSSNNNVSSHGGDETTLGSKEERRKLKRKINVAELFHFKKRRSMDTSSVSLSALSKTQQDNFSNELTHQKQSIEGELENGVDTATKLPSKKEKSEVSEEMSHSVVNEGQEECKKSEIDKIPAATTLKKNIKKSVGSQESKKKDNVLILGKRSRKKFNKYETGRKSYQSISTPSRKNGGDEPGKIEEEHKAQEQTLKPQEEWVPEGQPAYVVDGTGGPRKSIIVDDPRVPLGWSRHFIQRMSGHSAGKWDVFFVCPQGRKFRTRRELRAYYEDRGREFPNEQFDFSLGRRKNKPQSTEHETSSTSCGDLPGSVKISQQSDSSLPNTLPSTVKGVSSDTSQRRVKILLPRVRASDSVSAPISSDNDIPDEQCNVSDNPVVFGDLKIEKENDSYKCPKEGCSKFFRKESLLQMHLKHYHPEYNRFVASTPNVADLAYARTIGEPVEEMHPRTPRPTPVLKTSRFEAVRRGSAASGVISPTHDVSYNTTPNVSLPSIGSSSDSLGVTTSSHSNLADYHNSSTNMRSFDSPASDFNVAEQGSRNDVLNGSGLNIDVPKRTIRTLLPVTRTSSSEPCNVDVTDDTNDEIDVSEISPDPVLSVSVTEPNLEQIDSKVVKELPISISNNNMSQAKSRLPRRRHKPDFHTEPVMPKSKPSDSDESSQNTLVAGPSDQQASVETLRKEDLVNCICGYPEEDGLMIQCDLCMCWQHGICNNIELEDDVPEKYVCFICKHPHRERRSKHYLHDQDWLKEGRLPSLSFRSKNESDITQRTSVLKRSNELIGTILQLQQVIHSLRVKVNMVEKSDHPKLYLWNQSWEKVSLDGIMSNATGSKTSGVNSQSSEASKIEELNDFEQSNLNFNQLGNSSQPLNLQQSDLNLSLCHNLESNLLECQSNDLGGDTNNIYSGGVSSNLLTDDCDTKDTYFSQDSLVSTKGENVQSVPLQDKINDEENLPKLSDDLVVENVLDMESDSEKTTVSGTIQEKNEKIFTVEDEESVSNILAEDEHSEIETVDNSKDDLSISQNTKESTAESNKEENCSEDSELQLPFCPKDLMQLATTMADKFEPLEEAQISQQVASTQQEPSQQKAPQPEALIVPKECRKTLLDHIEAFQQQIELRLTSLETQIAGLESMDPYLANDDSKDQQTRETVQMLLRDLSVLNDVAALS